MTRPVAVVTDSTADLPPALAAEAGITVVPLQVLWEGQTYQDGVDLTADAFYARLRTAASMPTTSHPGPETFAAIYHRWHARGYAVYVLVLSARFSGTYQAAQLARQQVPEAEVWVEDSRTTSLALGFQALAAARVAAEGGDLHAVRAAAAAVRARSGVLFVPRTLAYMRRSGRLGPLQYRLASALRILPVLEIRDGGPALVARTRTFPRAVRRMRDEVVARCQGQADLHLAVLHADAADDARTLRDDLTARLRPQQHWVQTIGPVLGIHTGPGLLGVAYAWDLGGPHFFTA